ncbi:hypothetical protein [Pseudomonas sp.]|uniref:hypothetical protein n=1 Tax=Pseudomonas sp. TaxID=306 RepID=UPI0013034E73|nr:hypothetical protein [Pseudomonas sp.]
MSTFTVYFCGTSATHFDSHNANYWNGELIATLASNTLDREFAHWIVVDGPGSGNLQADNLTVESTDHPYAGVAFGKGWETNVRHALNMIKGQFEWQREKLTAERYQTLKKAGIPIEDVEIKGSFWSRVYDYGDRKVTPQQLQQQIVNQFRKGGKIPAKVNIVGWSRGAVSCHMLANAMLADPALKHIPVNIFAVDPVPGPLNFQPERVTLGPNVREYVGFFARDERSKGFACVVPHTDGSTKTSVFPLPGRHATLVGNAALDGVAGPKVLAEPGMVVRHLAETCLRRWGVSLAKCLNLTKDELVRAHAIMYQHDGMFTEMRKHSYTKVTESQGPDRAISYGNQWAAFSKVAGSNFAPAEGLAAPLQGAKAPYGELLG